MYVYTCAAIDDSNTSFSLTDTETTPFLYVDLGTPRGFHHVRVLANEAHTNLADGYQILIANTPRINASDMKNCTSILRPLSGSINEVACAGEGYRYVMIVLPGNMRALSLFSVDVIGGCEACAMSKYKSSEGFHECDFCKGGKYTATTANTKCKICGANTYAAKSNNR